jgi:pimeloyl-ACP methyl ester carboxylesterase
MTHLITTNNLTLHLIDHAGTTPLVLMPGLTANAHAFDGLIAAGLTPDFRVLALDLRGRGRSDQPETGYSFADHAADLLGILDQLGLERAIIGGHSYGGLLSLYIAAHFPERVQKLVILDAALGVVNPKTYELIKPAIDRLGQIYPDFDAYLALMRSSPVFANAWHPLIEDYYRADVISLPDGSVTPRTRPATIAAVIADSQAVDWAAVIQALTATVPPLLLVRGTAPYGPPDAPPIVSEEQVAATRALLPHIQVVEVPGNHFTMLYGASAAQIVAAIKAFAA